MRNHESAVTGPRLRHPLRSRLVSMVVMALSLAGSGLGGSVVGRGSSVRAEAQSPAPPTLTGPVNDLANVIDPESERELERRIRALQQASGDVVVVATVPSIEPYSDINEYAVRMFENGGKGIGQKGKDNGALIVLAMKERKVRIEVGYDLEEFITDGFAGETIRQVMTPQFRNNAFAAGLVAGTTRIINRIASRRGVELTDVPRDRQPIQAPRSFGSWKLILVVWIIIMILSSRRRRRRGGRWGRGPWSGWNSGVGPFGGGFGGGLGGGGFGGGFGGFGGGGGGGGFGGFGGGRSGGGGASGSW
jgi:uncharacterized protein